MSLADDRIDDCDNGPLWAKHFPKIAENAASKVKVLWIVYIIADKAKAGSVDGGWSDRVPQELRRHGIPPDEFWEIQSVASR